MNIGIDVTTYPTGSAKKLRMQSKEDEPNDLVKKSPIASKYSFVCNVRLSGISPPEKLSSGLTEAVNRRSCGIKNTQTSAPLSRNAETRENGAPENEPRRFGSFVHKNAIFKGAADPMSWVSHLSITFEVRFSEQTQGQKRPSLAVLKSQFAQGPRLQSLPADSQTGLQSSERMIALLIEYAYPSNGTYEVSWSGPMTGDSNEWLLATKNGG